MDHLEAMRIQATEKYVLGELSPDLREQFEEHYLDCPECTKDLLALSTFVTASRAIFTEEEAPSQAVPRREPVEKIGWFRWLRPTVMVPALAALAAVAVYIAVVDKPLLKDKVSTLGTVQVSTPSFRLLGPTRGESLVKVTVGPDQPFALDLDFTPNEVYQSYTIRLLDAAGKTAWTSGIGGEQRDKEVHLIVPGGKVKPGKYDLVFFGHNEAANHGLKENEVLRQSFSVEFSH